MKQTIYLFVFVLFALFCGCHSQQQDVELLNPDSPFSSISDFEAFAKSHPDSALQLLGSDLERPEIESDKADFYYKTLLYSEIRLKKFFPPESDTLPLAVVTYYDSIFYADSTGKADRRAFMQNQWLRARAHFVLGTAEQASYEYIKAMQHHLTALRILDAYFADSHSIMLLRSNIEFYMADVFYYMGYYPLSKTLFKENIHTSILSQDSVNIARAYYNLALLIIDIADQDSHGDTVLYYINEGMSYVNSQDHPYDMAQILNVKGIFYRYKRQREQAIESFQQAIELMPKDYDAIHALYNSLAIVYYYKEDYDSALLYLLKGYEAKQIYRKNFAARGASDIYRIMGKNDKAVEYSGIAEKNQKAIDLIKLKNTDVQVLYDNYIQDRNKQAAQQTTNYVIIAICILIAVGLVFFGFYLRNRFKVKRLKKEIAQKTQEIGKMQQHQSKQDRWNVFAGTKIFKKISELCSQEKLMIKTYQEAKIKLPSEDWKELQFVIDHIFNHFTNRLKKEYPTLTKNDFKFIYLTIMQLSDTQKAALMGVSVDAVYKRSLRMRHQEKIEDISSAVNKYL